MKKMIYKTLLPFSLLTISLNACAAPSEAVRTPSGLWSDSQEATDEEFDRAQRRMYRESLRSR